MHGREAIKTALEQTRDYLLLTLNDFTDADMLVRPVPGANHAAWQVGNVIAGDPFLVAGEIPDLAYPRLPAGFAERHGSKQAASDDAAGLLTHAEYVKLFTETRAVTIAALDQVSDADLDRPTSEAFRSWTPTLGHLLLMTAHHTMMHAGQFSVIRRKLGKPVVL